MRVFTHCTGDVQLRRVQVWRGLLDIFRNPSMVAMTCVLAVVVGVFCGGVFFHLERTIAGVQNRAGVIFFCLVFLGFLSVTSIDSLMTERHVIEKERRLGYYPGWLYMAAKCLLDSILMRALPAVLFSTPLYWMASLQGSGERYALFVFVMIAFTIGTQFQAMLLIEWNRRAGNATVLFVLALIIQMLFAGFLVNTESIPGVLRWIRYCSLIYYAFEACAINEFEVRAVAVGLPLGTLSWLRGRLLLCPHRTAACLCAGVSLPSKAKASALSSQSNVSRHAPDIRHPR
jgi:ATP-binding cassette, subfamily G (WHITE), member 2